MKIKYCVITEIRKLEDNLEDDLLLKMDEGMVVWGSIPSRFLPEGMAAYSKEGGAMEIKVAVFDEGEILICDESGVEIGDMRNPRKYGVTYEIFDDVEDAVKKSLEVRKII